MEDCVIQLLPAVLKTIDVCKCERCKMDILAYALNELPPKYVASPKGVIYTKLDAMHIQFDADVASALSKGAQVVKENPRHD
jgi:competence protein ComFB